jgi:hypothetical protein
LESPFLQLIEIFPAPVELKDGVSDAASEKEKRKEAKKPWTVPVVPFKCSDLDHSAHNQDDICALENRDLIIPVEISFHFETSPHECF